MLVAVQSPEGTKRIECKSSESMMSFMTKVQSAFELDSCFDCNLYKDRSRRQPFIVTERKRLSHYDIKHGDTVYLAFSSQKNEKPPSSSSNSSVRESSPKDSVSLADNRTDIPTNFVEDKVDTYLFKQNGCIQRDRDPKLCQHGAHGKCVHCVPVEPYDEDYLREQNIKHMSFHSYLRKLMGGIDKGKFAALENISCKIKSGCKEHPPWPQGICTKCQPNALTLNRQPYRHVDNVVFENPFLVERFLNYWRCTGNQRIGLLYGYYEPHKDVPLGIKATVTAIYEPPQNGSRDFLRLFPDQKAQIVDKIAEALGLVKVGWIFTDLIAEDLQKGTVKHIRNINSHFLSAQECIMAGYFQNKHPNPCKLSPDGYFGSKFVTVCFTGDANNHAHMEGYQVSNQCMALVRDNCLLPTLDAPELGYVRESSNEQYVPDVFYKVKDSYGNEIIQLARPLPIEYLLVDVPVSTPNEPQFTFYADASIKPFPVENRLDEHVQDFPHLVSYLRQFNSEQFLEAMSDFHLLIFIATMDVLPLMDDMGPLLEAIKNKDRDLAINWSKSERWATVEHLLDAEGSSIPHTQPSEGPQEPGDSATAMWICRHCTFLNQPQVSTCEMCGLPQ
ncbi:nuclear protein localization protein 4 homolog isoform X1 [Stegodyphus dumicola]|uniref:nuclear protein localization protein 4 homolog isoform X1 n=2 Tax=Stegodyphus dumicola TaxID=202533 RepID=UPI0015AE2924|nr:nuclear protein localization protein 4 homolog isoform X1 [Stegodyphus dumicola]